MQPKRSNSRVAFTLLLLPTSWALAACGTGNDIPGLSGGVLEARARRTGSPSRPGATTCHAGNLSALKYCVAQIDAYDEIQLTADIWCAAGECCSYGGPLITLWGKANKTIRGNGHGIYRYAQQKDCEALLIGSSSNVLVEDVTFDENDDGNYCHYEDGCKVTVRIHKSSNTTLRRVRVLHAKSSAVYGWGVTGLTFDQGEIRDAGVHGLEAGNPDWAPSTGLQLLNSTITRVRVNAVALYLNGDQENIVSNNEFSNNHWHGLWAFDDPYFGTGISPGGQVYLAMAHNMRFTGNTISHGFCENCLVTPPSGPQYQAGIPGIEIGQNYTGCVRDLEIRNNRVIDVDEAIWVSDGTDLDRSVSIDNNEFLNWGLDDATTNAIRQPHDAVVNSNRDLKTFVFNGFEEESDFSAGWNRWDTCYSAKTFSRWCPGVDDAMDGRCALAITTGSESCGGYTDGTFAQGMYSPIAAKNKAFLNMWYRTGGTGEGCLVFLDQNHEQLGQTCQKMLSVGQWRWAPMETVEAVPPVGTAYVGVKVAVKSKDTHLHIDDIRLTWY